MVEIRRAGSSGFAHFQRLSSESLFIAVSLCAKKQQQQKQKQNEGFVYSRGISTRRIYRGSWLIFFLCGRSWLVISSLLQRGTITILQLKKKKRNFKIFNTNSDSFRCSLKYSVCCFVYLFSFLMNFVFAIVICLRIKIRDFAFIVFKNPFLLMGFICLSFRFENFSKVTTF